MSNTKQTIYKSAWEFDNDQSECLTWDMVFRPSDQQLKLINQTRADRDNNIALQDGMTGECWSYKDVKDLSTRVAAGILTHTNTKEGDHVLIAMPTSPRFMILYVSLQRAGLIPVLCNPLYSSEEYSHVYDLVHPKVILAPSSLHCKFEPLKMVAKDNNDPPCLFIAADDSPISSSQHANVWDLAMDDMKQAYLLLDEEDPTLKAKRLWEMTAAIALSSGTSGLPKAVCLSHRAMANTFRCTSIVPGQINLQTVETSMICLPCFHIAGIGNWFAAAVKGDRHIFLFPKPFSLQILADVTAREACSRILVVPSILLGLIKTGLAKKMISSRKLLTVAVAAAPLGPELQMEAMKAFGGIPILQVWGMTETAGAVLRGFIAFPSAPGSVGRLIPGAELRIVDDDGNSVPMGTPGELLVKCKTIMTGYYGNEAATKHTIDEEGWLHTGDVATINADNDVFIVDRKKDLMKFKGFQVAPAELEAVICCHPAIMEVAVIGVPDLDNLNELPRAYIVPRAEAQMSQTLKQEVMDFVAERVASYKQLRGGVHIVQSLPKNASGKLLRRALRDSLCVVRV